MYSDHSVRNLWLACGCVLILATVATVLDRTQRLSQVRMVLHDAASPGRLVVLALRSRDVLAPAPTAATAPTDRPLAALQEELHRNEVQRRQLLIENARLHHQLQQSQLYQQLDDLPDLSLLDFRAQPARILSRSGTPTTLSDLFIDVGKSAGMRRSELVLDGSGLLIDHGSSSRLTAGDQVLSGRAVVGRIEKTGRWTSLVTPVTSAQFSSRVQLVRRTQQKAYFGAEGLLTGDDQGGCRVTGIAYTESVNQGDAVFSSDVNDLDGPRLYFGTVTAAEFLPGGEWSITVTPAADLSRIENVSVLQTALNPQRLSAQP